MDAAKWGMNDDDIFIPPIIALIWHPSGAMIGRECGEKQNASRLPYYERATTVDKTASTTIGATTAQPETSTQRLSKKKVCNNKVETRSRKR